MRNSKDLHKALQGFLQLEKVDYDEDYFPYFQTRYVVDEEDVLSFTDCFNALYNKSNEENYYWEHCSFRTYKNLFEERLKHYKIESVDGEIGDFIEKEMRSLDELYNPYDIFEPPYDNPPIEIPESYNIRCENGIYKIDVRILELSIVEKIRLAITKKRQFLDKYLAQKNAIIEEGQIITKGVERESNIIETPTLDLSNVKGTEKIIYLHELGVLDFLKNQQPFNLSINSLATVLSAITGEKSTTIQSYLNPMYSPSTHQKNNPLSKLGNVEKVKNQLINVGFNPNKHD